jgi:hypothetical protein
MDSLFGHTWRSAYMMPLLFASCLVFLTPYQPWAEIIVEENRLVFKGEGGPADHETVKQVQAFQKELNCVRPCPDFGSQLPHSLTLNLKRTVIQGVRFAVPTDRKFAVILSYVCSKPVLAGEVPYSCDSRVIVVDPKGSIRHSVRGNYLWIVPHESLPYFALIEDYCCDVLGKAILYNLTGKEICEAYLGRESSHLTGDEFTCGATWQEGKLVDKREIRLEPK